MSITKTAKSLGNSRNININGAIRILEEAEKRGVATLQAKLAVDSGKAKRELGTTFRPIAETLTNEVKWFRENGFAK